MPDSLARLRIQGNQTIGEEIVPDAIGTVEIKCGGARRNIDNPALGIERHPGPIVRRAAGLPGILRPSVMAKFTGTWNGVKRPAQLSGSSVVGSNVAGRRGKSLGVAPADDQQVFVYDGWTGQIHRHRAGRLPAKIFTQVDSAVVSKGRNRTAGGGV